MTVAENIAFGLPCAAARAPRPRRDRGAGGAPAAARAVGGLGGAFRRSFPAASANVWPWRAPGHRATAPAADEPFGALDAQVCVAAPLARHLHEELGLTTVFVTHDQEEALELADRVVVMNRGRIEQVGTPEEIYQQPATPFVVEFIGKVNRLAAGIADGRLLAGGARFEGDALELADGAAVACAPRALRPVHGRAGGRLEGQPAPRLPGRQHRAPGAGCAGLGSWRRNSAPRKRSAAVSWRRRRERAAAPSHRVRRGSGERRSPIPRAPRAAPALRAGGAGAIRLKRGAGAQPNGSTEEHGKAQHAAQQHEHVPRRGRTAATSTGRGTPAVEGHAAAEQQPQATRGEVVEQRFGCGQAPSPCRDTVPPRPVGSA